ncbi:4182_t:CDS:2 [Funneliformis geosporum]|uniref:4182_t:CDS:1 n=1 Tax=Funneliformis geosporum TaxID=1117311 RepID=A0A9W4WPE3_9GLOM|nr:4182_t:CDS:2 [Funneliformis geosporum]
MDVRYLSKSGVDVGTIPKKIHELIGKSTAAPSPSTASSSFSDGVLDIQWALKIN